MTSSPDPVERLIAQLARLPGVGEKSAARLAFYLMRDLRHSQANGLSSLSEDLAQALVNAGKDVRLCRVCANMTSSDLCNICSDPHRDRSVICVVESVADLRAIERAGVLRGTFHVLHGALAPLEGIGPEDLYIDSLVERVKSEGTREVVLAMNANVDGDTTALYLSRVLAPHVSQVSRLASGIPLGGELEYLDGGTLARAFADRRGFTD
ncbi:MAG: recombination mediator RecR [Myxococcota bacterium]|nr:recombination mediator RecR [Myxococcota bacterium]